MNIIDTMNYEPINLDDYIRNGSGATFSSVPYTSFELAGEIDYFVADNFRLSFSVGVPFTSSTIGQTGADNMKHNSVAVYFNPNVAYYVKLADRFYYTPELGGGYDLGSYKEKYGSPMLDKGKFNGITFI